MDAQSDLFAPPEARAAALEGLLYRLDLISPDEEAALARRIAELPFAAFAFQGWYGNRRTVYFGRRYDFDRRVVEEAPPIPGFLLPLRDKVAALAGRPAEDFVQALVIEYTPGAGIGWHRDRPQFGVVAGVSLLAPCSMRLRRKAGEGWDRAAQPLAPRSAYLLTGPARHVWEHSIAPMKTLRYAVTFRTLAEPAQG